MNRKLFFYIIAFLVILSNVFSDFKDNNKEEKLKLNIKFTGGLSQDFNFVNNQDLGFWGFVDSSVELEYFSGYFFGMILSIRPVKSMELFTDITILRSSLLMGKKGSYFKGISVWDADPNHEDSISPVLPNDIYYISKANMGRLGAKFIYSMDVLEPYIGLAFGLVPYEIAFGNKDGSTTYSEILVDVATVYSLIFGLNFDFKSNGKKLITLEIFFEVGSATTESKVMRDWIWQGWTYHSQFPVVPAYRFGVTLGF